MYASACRLVGLLPTSTRTNNSTLPLCQSSRQMDVDPPAESPSETAQQASPSTGGLPARTPAQAAAAVQVQEMLRAARDNQFPALQAELSSFKGEVHGILAEYGERLGEITSALKDVQAQLRYLTPTSPPPSTSDTRRKMIIIDGICKTLDSNLAAFLDTDMLQNCAFQALLQRHLTPEVRLDEVKQLWSEGIAKQAGGPSGSAAPPSKSARPSEISEVFESLLVQYYVDKEERELLGALKGAVREEVERRWLPDEEEGDVTGKGTRVLQSANKIFLLIRASQTRCSKNLFRRVLSKYAVELMGRLPKTAAGDTSANPTVVGGSTHCACMNVLVLGINTRLDGPLLKMTHMKWDAIKEIGDESPFVATIRKVHLFLFLDRNLLTTLLPFCFACVLAAASAAWQGRRLQERLLVLLDCAFRLGSCLEAANLSFLCDKVPQMFIPRLHESIFRLRRVVDLGVIQLAIDMNAANFNLKRYCASYI
uniref:VPS53Cf n=1 Tax=Volvox carteri f. nagariensis TaxID=3068 RepID=D9CIW5_VOLCA|nr:VPS53Cf [Volvox carteri f. nagariensis]